MAYGERYNTAFTNQDGVLWEIFIDELDYTGASSDFKCSGQPVVTRYGGTGDHFNPVQGSEVTIFIISESDYQYIDLYTNNARKYKVRINKNSAVYWKGFVNPGQYSEPLLYPPYGIAVTASDQLGLLNKL